MKKSDGVTKSLRARLERARMNNWPSSSYVVVIVVIVVVLNRTSTRRIRHTVVVKEYCRLNGGYIYAFCVRMYVSKIEGGPFLRIFQSRFAPASTSTTILLIEKPRVLLEPKRCGLAALGLLCR